MPNSGFNVKGKESDEWETPPWLFQALDAEFRFTLDPCATPENAKCGKFFSKTDDGLSKVWLGHRLFINPPYSNIWPWVTKALSSLSLSVMLLPMRTDNDWFHLLQSLSRPEIRYFRRRIKFLLDGKEQKNPRFSSIVVVMR